MRLVRLVPAAMAAILLAVPAAMAAEGEAVYPRVYTAEDCRDLLAQLAESMRSSNLDAAVATSIQGREASAERACNSGNYAAGTRQLRDLVDEVIASRH
ncbi:MAG: hypothetical protein U1E53_08910 [Dongiaceae bacterium]